jgi:hydroxymethylpyrimidine pyrophosphatase-like HAD family hydrolase/energy-coupling factor transporter ATP-binding protein EcfA2
VVRYVALATDYDGTLAGEGRVTPEAVEAVERLRQSGRSTILVTGRLLEDLRAVFDRLDLFDRVVAENGAVVFDPATDSLRSLADPPPTAFVDELRAARVEPLDVGHVIVATWEPNETQALETIRDLGLELQVIFNKGAVMVLPSGVNKASGLAAALQDLALSAHNVVGIGDAENDHAFLDVCELSVAVDNALPAVKDRCDHVTTRPRGDGVIELIDQLLEDDLQALDDRLPRHDVQVGRTDDGEAVSLRPFRTNALVAGASGSGKSTLVTTFVEGLIDHGYQVCLIDPEGDFAELEGATVLGSAKRGPTSDEVLEVLESPSSNVIVNLLGIRLDDRPAFLEALLPRIQELRATTGRPHWIVVDEAHHLLPAALQTARQILPRHIGSLMMVTVHPEALSDEALELVDVVITTSDPGATFGQVAERLRLRAPDTSDLEPPRGSAVIWERPTGDDVRVFSVLEPSAARTRHVRKYAEGDVKEKAFHFRGPDGRLNLRAQNLALFSQIAEGIDDETWTYHLDRGDYERWFRDVIKDDDLVEVAAGARDGLDAAESRRRILEAIQERYTLPA